MDLSGWTPWRPLVWIILQHNPKVIDGGLVVTLGWFSFLIYPRTFPWHHAHLPPGSHTGRGDLYVVGLEWQQQTVAGDISRETLDSDVGKLQRLVWFPRERHGQPCWEEVVQHQCPQAWPRSICGYIAKGHERDRCKILHLLVVFLGNTVCQFDWLGWGCAPCSFYPSNALMFPIESCRFVFHVHLYTRCCTV